MLYSFDSDSEFLANIQTCSDELLMAAVQQERTEGLNELYRRHSPTIRAVIARVLHNEQSVEDLLQEVFLEVWRLAGRYSSEKGKALGWIITLSRRRAIDRLRREQAYSRVEERYQKETEQQPEAWTQVQGTEDVESADLRRVLAGIIQTLPEAQRTAVEMAFYKGMSQREISTQTGIALGTIKTRLELALKKISFKLKELSYDSVPFSAAA
jgi:RNA polymerase sigma-70 factor (ECF subfamily)